MKEILVTIEDASFTVAICTKTDMVDVVKCIVPSYHNYQRLKKIAYEMAREAAYQGLDEINREVA